tara:strand:+ start:544 stop:753 length:210 start_codon:yes stop_codon:yes gene_type:complete
MISQNDDEDMFEDYPQDFIEKMDDLKGKASKSSKVSMFEHCRNGYDEIESPKGMTTYKIERYLNDKAKN